MVKTWYILAQYKLQYWQYWFYITLSRFRFIGPAMYIQHGPISQTYCYQQVTFLKLGPHKKNILLTKDFAILS